MTARRILITGIMLMTAACVPRTPAPPPQQPQQRPAPVPLPPPPPTAVDWVDRPLSPGNWYYQASGSESRASFGAANSGAQFTVRCDRAARQVTLTREGLATSGAMTIRTSTSARALPATVQRAPMAYLVATLPANDRTLDAMVFSRGRFTVEAAGLPMLVIPTWPEPARVIEDCRG